MAIRKTVEISVAPAIGREIAQEIGLVESVASVDCYVRVSDIHGNKNQMAAQVDYLTYQNRVPVMRKAFSFQPNIDGGNFIEQAYEHLKSLPEFAGAVDC